MCVRTTRLWFTSTPWPPPAGTPLSTWDVGPMRAPITPAGRPALFPSSVWNFQLHFHRTRTVSDALCLARNRGLHTSSRFLPAVSAGSSPPPPFAESASCSRPDLEQLAACFSPTHRNPGGPRSVRRARQRGTDSQQRILPLGGTDRQVPACGHNLLPMTADVDSGAGQCPPGAPATPMTRPVGSSRGRRISVARASGLASVLSVTCPVAALASRLQCRVQRSNSEQRGRLPVTYFLLNKGRVSRSRARPLPLMFPRGCPPGTGGSGTVWAGLPAALPPARAQRAGRGRTGWSCTVIGGPSPSPGAAHGVLPSPTDRDRCCPEPRTQTCVENSQGDLSRG